MELTFPMAMALASSKEGESEAAEVDLVAASCGGDPGAFAALVRRHQARVFHLAGRFFRQRADVEEVAQETFFAAWRRLSTYQARAPFEHWITRICLRCCYARLGAERQRSAPWPAQEPAAPMRDPSAAIDLEALLSRLSPADRFVLLLLDGEGWSVQEIARSVGWSASNVKVRAFRARRRLRRLLEDTP